MCECSGHVTLCAVCGMQSHGSTEREGVWIQYTMYKPSNITFFLVQTEDIEGR